jgi:predicted negative regulator of RcsB-dependent stress response
MNEQTAKYVKLLKANIDRVVVVVMFCLLGLLVWLWWGEQNPIVTEGAEGKAVVFKDPVADNPHYKTVLASKQGRDLVAYPEIDQIAKFNMFEYKSVKQKEAIEREANQKLVQAQDAATRGQNEEAKRLLKEILDSFPSHQKARELMEKLAPSSPETGVATAASAGSTTAPVPGA